MANRINSFNGDLLGDLREQEVNAQAKRLEPASPTEFLKWVAETLREHREKYGKLRSAHQKLRKDSEVATVGLKRLESLIIFKDKYDLDHLQRMHETLTQGNAGIDYTLDRCQRVLDETATNYQLIGETLKDQLADRHKKIGMQKELGLRLRDIEEQFDRCFLAVANQKKIVRQLSEGIQKLMHKASIKLPPKVKEDIHREDEIQRVALDYRKQLKQQRKNISPAPYSAPKNMAGYGSVDTEAKTEASSQNTDVIEQPRGLDPKYAIAAAAAGATLGVILLFGKGNE